MSVGLAVKVLGAGQHVGKSCVLAAFGDAYVMFDCGIQTGLKGRQRFPQLDSNTSPSCVLITHYHLDHVGALPYLTEVLGYRGPVFATDATKRFAKLALNDCWLKQFQNQQSQKGLRAGREFKPRGRKGGEIGQEPAVEVEEEETSIGEDETMASLVCRESQPPEDSSAMEGSGVHFSEVEMTAEMVQRCIDRIQTLQLDSPTEVADRLQVTALPAGHVVGACMFKVVDLRGDYGSILYTGDFTVRAERVFASALAPPREPVSLVISEATYGDQQREMRRFTEFEFCAAIHEAIEKGGKVLIPVSGLGKAHEVAALLSKHWQSFDLKAPIVLGPGTLRRSLPVYASVAAKGWTKEDLSSLPGVYASDQLIMTEDGSAMEATNGTDSFHFLDYPGALVLLASPRNLDFGVSLTALLKWGGDPDNLIVLLGFSVPGTIAHQLIHGAKTLTTSQTQRGRFISINPHPERKELEQQVAAFKLGAKLRYYPLAAHPDTFALQNFICGCSPLMTMLVHGEVSGMKNLRSRLQNLMPKRPIVLPENDQVILVQFPHPQKSLLEKAAPSLVGADEQKNDTEIEEIKTASFRDVVLPKQVAIVLEGLTESQKVSTALSDIELLIKDKAFCAKYCPNLNTPSAYADIDLSIFEANDASSTVKGMESKLLPTARGQSCWTVELPPLDETDVPFEGKLKAPEKQKMSKKGSKNRAHKRVGYILPGGIAPIQILPLAKQATAPPVPLAAPSVIDLEEGLEEGEVF